MNADLSGSIFDQSITKVALFATLAKSAEKVIIAVVDPATASLKLSASEPDIFIGPRDLVAAVGLYMLSVARPHPDDEPIYSSDN